ncbi:MAG: hypothetical protein JSU73_10720 [candidate division WOR-3 bacterium]|nr:MAG: hypothetical protein JSU73_10720 [candidate division WOR-3 bacterium]
MTKTRIIVWSIAGALAVAGYIWFINSDSESGEGERRFSRDELLEFASNMENRLVMFQDRFERALADAPPGPVTDSCSARMQARLERCRKLLDSLYIVADLKAGTGLRDSLEDCYGEAKDEIFRMESLAGSGKGPG